MVNEYSIDSAIVDGKAKIERYGGVHSDRVFVMSLVWIDIPGGKSLAAFIHTASALTQAIDTLLAGKRTRQPHSSGCDSEPLQVRFQDGTCFGFTKIVGPLFISPGNHPRVIGKCSRSACSELVARLIQVCAAYEANTNHVTTQDGTS